MPTAVEEYQLHGGQLVRAGLVSKIYWALEEFAGHHPAEVLLDLRTAAQDATHKVSPGSRKALGKLDFLTVRPSGYLMIGGVESLIIEQSIDNKGAIVSPTIAPISK